MPFRVLRHHDGRSLDGGADSARPLGAELARATFRLDDRAISARDRPERRRPVQLPGSGGGPGHLADADRRPDQRHRAGRLGEPAGAARGGAGSSGRGPDPAADVAAPDRLPLLLRRLAAGTAGAAVGHDDPDRHGSAWRVRRRGRTANRLAATDRMPRLVLEHDPDTGGEHPERELCGLGPGVHRRAGTGARARAPAGSRTGEPPDIRPRGAGFRLLESRRQFGTAGARATCRAHGPAGGRAPTRVAAPNGPRDPRGLAGEVRGDVGRSARAGDRIAERARAGATVRHRRTGCHPVGGTSAIAASSPRRPAAGWFAHRLTAPSGRRERQRRRPRERAVARAGGCRVARRGPRPAYNRPCGTLILARKGRIVCFAEQYVESRKGRCAPDQEVFRSGTGGRRTLVLGPLARPPDMGRWWCSPCLR
jgi:hypothetical protein